MNPTDIVSTNDSTIVGVLLLIITILTTAFGFLWKAYQKTLEYSRSQDKENLLMLMKMTEAITVVSKQSDKLETKVDDIKSTSESILSTIQMRLKMGRDGG